MLSQGRGGAGLVTSASGQYLHVMGGFTGKENNEVHSFSLETQTWDCPRCPAHTPGGSGMPFRSGALQLIFNCPCSCSIGTPIWWYASHSACVQQPDSLFVAAPDLCLHERQFSSFAGVYLAAQRMSAVLAVHMPITLCCLEARLSLVILGMLELGVSPTPPFAGIRCVCCLGDLR